MKRPVLGALTVTGMLLLSSCGEGGNDGLAAASAAEQCEALIATMAKCHPDLANEGSCTQETLELAAKNGLYDQSCTEITEAGKADWFSFRGCDPGQHVCDWIFCCDDYRITWSPSGDRDWDFVSVVQVFQAAAPLAEVAEIDAATEAELGAGVSVNFVQSVQEYSDEAAEELGVHISKIRVDIPYADFQKALPAAAWGTHLDHYLGGEVQVIERDDQNRVVRQLERMVLSPFPVDFEAVCTNNDMTKVEIIEYAEDVATVYWRVMYSNNGSTVTDVGSVDFRAHDEKSTLITFHSAHRINALGGIRIPNSLLRPVLSMTFMDFLTHYKKLVQPEG